MVLASAWYSCLLKACTGNSDVNKGLEMAAKALGATKVDKQISEYKQNVPVINIRKRRESKI